MMRGWVLGTEGRTCFSLTFLATRVSFVASAVLPTNKHMTSKDRREVDRDRETDSERDRDRLKSKQGGKQRQRDNETDTEKITQTGAERKSERGRGKICLLLSGIDLGRNAD